MLKSFPNVRTQTVSKGDPDAALLVQVRLPRVDQVPARKEIQGDKRERYHLPYSVP